MMIKKIFRAILLELIFGGHVQGLVGAAIFLTIIILLNKNISLELPLIGYLLTFFNYRLNYYKGIKEDTLTNLKRAEYLKNNIKYSRLLLLFSFILIFWLIFYYTEIKVAVIAIFLLIIGACYTFWFKNWTQKITGFKNLYISISIALFTVIVGAYYSLFNWGLLFIAIFIFLRMFLNTIFFDIKDVASDEKEGLKTFPVAFGKAKTLYFLHILNLLSFLPVVIGVYLDFIPSIALILLIFFFYDLYYLKLINNPDINTQNFAYVIADAEFLLWPIVLFITKAILLVF